GRGRRPRAVSRRKPVDSEEGSAEVHDAVLPGPGRGPSRGRLSRLAPDRCALCATELPEDGRRNAILLTTALWNVSTQFESKALHALSIMEQRLLGPQLAADGSRPVAISVAPGPDGGLPVATSVWHRPLVPEEAKDRHAKRQANAAVALLRLERERNVWPLLQ